MLTACRSELSVQCSAVCTACRHHQSCFRRGSSRLAGAHIQISVEAMHLRSQHSGDQ